MLNSDCRDKQFRFKNWTCSVLLCFFSVIIYGQKDTLYLEDYYKKIVPRISYTYKMRDFYFTNNSNGIKTTTTFQTGNQFLIGGYVSYKWINIGYAFSLNPKQSKRNMDFGAATSYKPFQFQFNISMFREVDYSLTRKQKGSNADTLLYQRENNVEIITSKLKVDYVFNYHKYSYKAGFKQTDRQIKSIGSAIASFAISNDNFNLEEIDDRAKTKFDSLHGFTNTLIAGIDLGLGYGYNWALRKGWTISLVEIPNAEIQFLNAKALGQGGASFSVAFVNHFKAGIVYVKNNYFIGFSAYNMVSISNINNGKYMNVYNSIEIYIGWLIDEKKFKLKR